MIVTDSQDTPLSNVRSVAAGESVYCALKEDSTVWCWGSCSSGAVGNPACTTGATVYPLPVQDATGAALEGIDVLGGGGQTFCAANASGTVLCWGVALLGTEGEKHFVAQEVLTLPGVTRIDAGGSHACALAGGVVTCWGSNQVGQSSGTPSDGGDVSPPVTVAISGGAIDIAVGYQHSCAVTSAHQVVCWGVWANGTPALGPELVKAGTQPLGGVTAAAGMYWHSCALAAGGAPTCWGQNATLWLGGTESNVGPTAVLSASSGTQLEGMTRIRGKGIFACAASPEEVYCWGDIGYDPISYGCLSGDAGPSTGCSPDARRVDGLPTTADIAAAIKRMNTSVLAN